MTLDPLHTDPSQGSPLAPHSTTDSANRPYYLERVISLSYLHKVFAVGTRADGLETEVLTETRQQKADASTRR